MFQSDRPTRQVSEKCAAQRPRISAATLVVPAFFALMAGKSSWAQHSFYNVAPHEVPGRPGSIIRAEPMPNAPYEAAAAYRVIYRSTNAYNTPVAVSGVVLLPRANAPASGRPIVTWAHPTTGIARSCAPSLRSDVFTRIAGLKELLVRGYIVTATDYHGLGTDGVHPYLVGHGQGHSVLDAVRAAREMPDARAGAHFITWGYSQGGHASLFAGNLAHSYAPELRLIGIAAVAPPTALSTLFRADVTELSAKVVMTYAMLAWSRIYNFPIDSVLSPRVTLVAERIGRECSETERDFFRLGLSEQLFEREGFFSVDVTVTEPWRDFLTRNSPGVTPAGVPVFIAQGSADTLVRPEITERYRNMLCAQGRAVRFELLPNADHTGAIGAATASAVQWIEGRFAGLAHAADCR